MNDRVDAMRLLRVENEPATAAGAGVVVAVEPAGGCRVRFGDEVVAMSVAFSCLVVPAAGDRVGWCLDSEAAGSAYWITHVLARPGGGAVTLRLPPDTTLQSGGGTLRLAADSLRLEADEVQVRSRHTAVVFETAETVGACWQGVVAAMRWTGTTLTTVVDRLTTIAKTRQQFTEGSDLLQAGTLDIRASGLGTLHAEHLVLEGERLVKARAPQIHMG